MSESTVQFVTKRLVVNMKKVRAMREIAEYPPLPFATECMPCDPRCVAQDFIKEHPDRRPEFWSHDLFCPVRDRQDDDAWKRQESTTCKSCGILWMVAGPPSKIPSPYLCPPCQSAYTNTAEKKAAEGLEPWQ